jgi:hypothetical protein
MQSFAVVDLVDEAWKIGGHVLGVSYAAKVDDLDLQGLHEAPGFGVMVGIAGPEGRFVSFTLAEKTNP